MVTHRWLLWVLPLVLMGFLLTAGSHLSPMLMAPLLLLSVITFLLALSFALVPQQVHSQSVHPSPQVVLPSAYALDGVPGIPRTHTEAWASLSDADFERFSAAVILAQREGHRFRQHCGQSGDGGVDVRLWNAYNELVVVQSKRYAADHHVGQPAIREFLGSIQHHNAAYGIFITTSTFTADAYQVINASKGRIRVIDGHKMDVLLQRRSREIALAYQDVLDACAASPIPE